MPPPHDMHGRIPAIQLPGFAENQADSPAVWLEHLFEVTDDIFDRLAQLFSEVIPPEAQTATQRRLANRLARYVTSTMAQEIQDLAKEEAHLRSLADRLARVREVALEGAIVDKDGLLQTTEVE